MARTVLVVDDEPDLVTSCERLLQRVGHASLRAHTGPDALAFLDRENPDLVVTDLRLPGIDGLAVVRHARGHVPPIPVILITGYDSPQARSARQGKRDGRLPRQGFVQCGISGRRPASLGPGVLWRGRVTGRPSTWARP